MSTETTILSGFFGSLLLFCMAGAPDSGPVRGLAQGPALPTLEQGAPVQRSSLPWPAGDGVEGGRGLVCSS